jgi:hypothetical protein
LAVGLRSSRNGKSSLSVGLSRMTSNVSGITARCIAVPASTNGMAVYFHAAPRKDWVLGPPGYTH